MYAQYQQYQNQNHQYQQQQQQQQPPNHEPQIIPPNPVQTFTRYYHAWTKRVEELTKRLQTCNNNSNNNSNERQTIESNRQWAKYYAEESSRAAHHFHQNPQATSAPFALPPSPPNAQSIYNTNTNINAIHANHNTAKNAVTKTYASAARSSGTAHISSSNNTNYTNNNNSTSKSTSTPGFNDNNPHGSITRYVKRNMERHRVQNDPSLRKYVQAEIEKVIAAAIQTKTFQSKNWDLVPLIALVGDETNGTTALTAKPAQAPYQQPHQQQHQQSDNGRHYYEHNSSVAPANQKYYYGNNISNSNNDNCYGSVAASGRNLETNGSYYGPASSHNENINSTHNSRKFNSSGNKNNNDSFSSSPFIGQHNANANKNGKRHQEEDFIAVGHYGPGSSSSSSSNNASSSNKRAKKNHWKNHNIPITTGTMYNDGLDHSDQVMTKRANRFSGRGGIREASSSSSGRNNSSHDKYMGKGTIGGTNVTLDETDFEQMTVKGTSMTLEKGYLRLTAPPRAELVRPLEILQQHLGDLRGEYFGCGGIQFSHEDQSNNSENKNNNLSILLERMETPEEKWKATDGEKERQIPSNDRHGRPRPRRRHDYLWFCSQLKAIRQDCTVQRIQGDLAVDAYETHARIALQEGDLNEYNQCQTQLKELYKTLPSTDSRNKSVLVRGDGIYGGWKHEEEFIAYRLLYYVFLSTNETYSGGSSDMYHIMLSLTAKERNHPAISHALKVREAVALSDYFWFFRLHRTSPYLGIFLTELLVPTMRLRGLRRIAKAYRPSVELKVCFEQLGFCDHKTITDGRVNKFDDDTKNDGKDDDGCKMNEEAKLWLISCGGIIDQSKFITKDSDIHAPVTKDTKKNSLI